MPWRVPGAEPDERERTRMNTGSGQPDLDQRSHEALRIIVQEHVRSGQPVSSRRVAALHPEALSSATIRNLMAELTDAGLLAQPHTSAGRVPTDHGYRQVVNEVLGRKRRVSRRDARRIEDLLFSSRKIDDLLSRAGKLLSAMTHQVGLVLAPDLEQALLEYVEFVRIAPQRFVAIFVSRAGLITHRVFNADEDIHQEELDHLSARLREQFTGLTLPETRQRMIEALQEDRRWALQLGQMATESVISYLRQPFPEESGELIVEGASSLLDAPEFADLERLREVMVALEERTKLLKLLDRCLSASGVQVIIGGESADPDFAPVSLVASPYRMGELMKGLVGIVGPRRMEYARAVALVDHFARTLSLALGGHEEEEEKH